MNKLKLLKKILQENKNQKISVSIIDTKNKSVLFLDNSINLNSIKKSVLKNIYHIDLKDIKKYNAITLYI